MNVLTFFRYIRFPIRLLAMIPILMSLLWSSVSSNGLVVVIFFGLLAVVLGELLGRTKLRTSAILTISLICVAAAVFGLSFLLSSVHLSESLGPHNVIAAHGVLQCSVWVFLVCAALRALAQRHVFFFAIEFWAMALACAHAFLPHRNRAVLQPLWLSDRAWSEGIDPTAMLSAIGIGLAVVLVVLTLLERVQPVNETRNDASSFIGVLILLGLLPVFLVSLLLLIDPPSLNDEEPPDQLSEIMQDINPTQGSSGTNGEANSGEGDGQQQGQAQKPIPVAVVLFESDYYPPSQYYYLRQDAFSAFNGFRLGPSSDPDIPIDGIRGFPSQTVFLNEDAPMMNRDRIIGKVALLSPHNSPFGIERLLRYSPTINTRPGTFVRTYAFESAAMNIPYKEMVDHPVGNPDWSPELKAHYLALPPDDRYKELADSIVEGLQPQWRDNPFAQALIVKLHLDKKTKYTKRVRHTQADDPTASFLFGPTNQYIGYCVHTAHAAALLWRALGLPARIAVGYAVDAENRRSDGFLVQDIDAHAWPEIYLQDIGWVPLDISPAQNLDPMGDPPDPALSDSLLDMARQQEDMTVVQTLKWSDIWALWRPFLMKWLGTLIIFILAVHYLFKFSRRYWPLFSHSHRAVYVSASDGLSEIGIFRHRGESRDAFACRIGPQYPAWQNINRLCQATRFGSKGLPVDTILSFHRDLFLSIRKEVPFYRRLLGLLNPFSFYRSR